MLASGIARAPFIRAILSGCASSFCTAHPTLLWLASPYWTDTPHKLVPVLLYTAKTPRGREMWHVACNDEDVVTNNILHAWDSFCFVASRLPHVATRARLLCRHVPETNRRVTITAAKSLPRDLSKVSKASFVSSSIFCVLKLTDNIWLVLAVFC